MVDRHALYDRLEKHRFAGTGWSDDEGALAVAYGRDQVDCSAGELGSALRGLACFELEFPLRIRRDERSEIGSARCFGGIDAVDLLDVYYYDAIAVVMSGGRENLIAATQHVLTHYLRRHVRIARLSQIAICGATNEAAFALWIEPSSRLAVWNYRSYRSALLRLALSALLLLLLWLALSAAPTLIASASSVVAVAIARVTVLLLIAVAAVVGLLIVLLLLLRASTIDRAVAGLRIRKRSGVGVGSRLRRGLRRWSWCGRGKCW
jgi:hypothetical protein